MIQNTVTYFTMHIYNVSKNLKFVFRLIKFVFQMFSFERIKTPINNTTYYKNCIDDVNAG